MATLIFFLSAAALLQFFISYCRSLIAASIKQPLSAEFATLLAFRTRPPAKTLHA